MQGNLSVTYKKIGRHNEALRLRRDAYFGLLKVSGKEDRETLGAALNYADSLLSLNRFEEAKSVLHETIPVARRVLGECHEITLWIRSIYAWALYSEPSATLDDLREAVSTLEDTERIARRVFGGANPTTEGIERSLELARAALRAREETPSGGA